MSGKMQCIQTVHRQQVEVECEAEIRDNHIHFHDHIQANLQQHIGKCKRSAGTLMQRK